MSDGEKPVVYIDPYSEPCRSVMWLIHEAGLQERVHVELTWLGKGQHATEEFLKINPRHQVPALRHGTFTLSECTAIMRYLCEHFEVDARLHSGDVRQRARIEQLLSWHHTNLRQKGTLEFFLSLYVSPFFYKVPFDDAEKEEKMWKATKEVLATLDGFIGENCSADTPDDEVFLAGNSLTIADMFIACDLSALEIHPGYAEALAALPNVARWVENLRQRPCYQNVHQVWYASIPRMRTIVLEKQQDAPRDWIYNVERPSNATIILNTE